MRVEGLGDDDIETFKNVLQKVKQDSERPLNLLFIIGRTLKL